MRLFVPLLALASITLGVSLLFLAVVTWSNAGLEAIPYAPCLPGTFLAVAGGVLFFLYLAQDRAGRDRDAEA